MILIFLIFSLASAVEHHLYWNSSNPIWKEPDPIMHVRFGDRIRIYCPDSYKDQRTSHLKVFQVSEFSYAECMLETGKQQVVLCNGNEASDRPRSQIITVRPYSSTPNALTFSVGQYYWISTSNGRVEGMDRTMYGLCKTHQMRLKINVSERLVERQTTVKTTEPTKDLPTTFESPQNIPGDLHVNKEQLEAVIQLASQGKTGTYTHNNIMLEDSIEDAQPWNPLETNYYKNYYKQDSPLYETVDSKSAKDYEIGEDLSIGRSYPSYLSSSSRDLLPLFLFLIFFL